MSGNAPDVSRNLHFLFWKACELKGVRELGALDFLTFIRRLGLTLSDREYAGVLKYLGVETDGVVKVNDFLKWLTQATSRESCFVPTLMETDDEGEIYVVEDGASGGPAANCEAVSRASCFESTLMETTTTAADDSEGRASLDGTAGKCQSAPFSTMSGPSTMALTESRPTTGTFTGFTVFDDLRRSSIREDEVEDDPMTQGELDELAAGRDRLHRRANKLRVQLSTQVESASGSQWEMPDMEHDKCTLPTGRGKPVQNKTPEQEHAELVAEMRASFEVLKVRLEQPVVFQPHLGRRNSLS
eukprot:TRINITY_DN64111_c0_g1_i1.p1 TRINITY_DN64111_c0_g1~~TRINITY_DN64111_c0_g1_i1.p1  ORF type:complete len:301 (+),score=46.94 TRINITY_DN64111_c0_g1_i1:75-977(+)